MVISDKEAYRVLGLPLGVDKDAICERYKQLSCKLSASKIPEDKRKLEQVVAAYSQLLSQAQRQLASQQSQTIKSKSKNNRIQVTKLSQDNHYDSSSDEDDMKGKNGNIHNGIIKNDSEIDKDRRKAEKRRAKKKKQKEKKKQGKLEDNNTTPNNNKKAEESNSDTEDDIGLVEEVQGIDPNSAFVAMVGKKIGTNGVHSSLSNTSSNSIRSSEDTKKIKNFEKSNDVTLSRQLAMRGNEEANKGAYDRAVRLFSEAIRLDPNDHRFFGNRSYCYDQLHEHDKALKDAERAIKLAAEWPKGHFRRGRALKGLGKLLEAEAAFEQVLKFDPGCEDAILEMNKVRKRRIVEMGFTELQAKAAIKKYSQVQPALDALLAGEFQNSLENIFFSDDEDEADEDAVWQPPTKQKDHKMNPRNVDGLTSLWVGNVVPEVTEKILTKLFSKYGTVTSVRQLKEKYCAFVNYSDKKSAGNAMENLQSYELCGSRLLIKFPDNPILNGSQNIIIRKNKNQTVKTTVNIASQTSSDTGLSNSAPKTRGPVNGDECYFWRTTGCGYDDKCHYKHIPKHKGVDKKPWQK